MVKVFVSYKRGTAAIAPLRKSLRKARYRLWYDKDDIHAGTNWREAIDKGIDGADGVIVGLTPAACASEYVQYEVERAKQQGKPIFPVKVEAIEDGDLKALGVDQLHFIDFTGAESDAWDDAIGKLIADMERAGLKIKYPPRWKIALAGLVLLIVVGGLIWIIRNNQAKLPAPEPLTLTQLNGRQIRDIASGGDYLWLATDVGLAQYNISSGILKYIPNTKDIQSVGSSADGQEVWFGYTENGKAAHEGKPIGHYSLGAQQQQLEALTPEGKDIPPLQTTALSLVVQDAVWVGAQEKGVYRYDPKNSTWAYLTDRIEGQDIPPYLDAVRIAIAQGASGASQRVVWMTNLSILYRWELGRPDWTYYSYENTKQGLGRNVSDVTLDSYQNLWVGYLSGLSVLPAKNAWTADKTDDVWVKCSADNSPLPKGAVQRIVTSDGGAVLWIVTDGGVARVNAQETINGCDSLGWRTWVRPDSYEGAFGGRVKVAISQRQVNGRTEVTLWIARFTTDKVESITLK